MLKPGQLIDDKYRIIRLIGEGGMGAVYEAEHAFLGRHVAIKVLAPGMAETPEAIRRFYQEAKAAAKIGHDNICDVTDVGQAAGGMPYIVMQLLHGKSLAAEIAAQGPLRIGRAVDIGRQALAALSAAHAAGIVHRDMKPDNIFLTRVGDRDDFVKLLDFGISKVRSAARSGGIGLTKTGAVLGTPAYMSPEQARGEADVDLRADVWAMGIVVYEMLVGTPPFEGTNYNQVLYGVLCAPIQPPRSRRPEVSAELDAVVMRALDRDRAGRFTTADAFAEALRAAWLTVAERRLVVEPAVDHSRLGIGEDTTAVTSFVMPPSPPAAVAPSTTPVQFAPPQRPVAFSTGQPERAAPFRAAEPTARPAPVSVLTLSPSSAPVTPPLLASRADMIPFRRRRVPVAWAMIVVMVILLGGVLIFVLRASSSDDSARRPGAQAPPGASPVGSPAKPASDATPVPALSATPRPGPTPAAPTPVLPVLAPAPASTPDAMITRATPSGPDAGPTSPRVPAGSSTASTASDIVVGASHPPGGPGVEPATPARPRDAGRRTPEAVARRDAGGVVQATTAQDAGLTSRAETITGRSGFSISTTYPEE